MVNSCGTAPCPVNSGTFRSRVFVYPDVSLELPVLLRAAGHHKIYAHSYNWPGAGRCGRDRVLIQYTLRGRGALEFDGGRMEVPPECAMLLTLPEDHRYFLPPESSYWEVLFISFGGEEAVKMLKALRKRFGTVVSLRENSSPILLLRELLDAPEPESVYDAAAMGFRFFMELARELERYDGAEPRPEFIDRALDYCRNHLDGECSVETLARQAGLSRWYFSREFKRWVGMPPQELVGTLRMKLALQLLQSTRLSVKEIAMRCGFSDPSYFVKVFVRHHHFTPGGRQRIAKM